MTFNVLNIRNVIVYPKSKSLFKLIIIIQIILFFQIELYSFEIQQDSGINTGSSGKSIYTMRLEDKNAVYLTADNFSVTPNEEGDDSDALQNAIDKVAEQTTFGVVFIPEGEYQLSKTIYVWEGIRLIGYGENRPVFVLEENTPGYQEGDEKYLIHFVSNKPKEDEPIRDANPGTFYSAISNINFVIKNGNPAAIAIRSHYAQHCYIAHVDFHLGTAKAGIEKVGNEIEDCRFYEGQYGIVTTKPAPSWPFLMIDCYFEGQTEAAISTEEGGLTIVRNYFKNVPGAVVVNPDRDEELFIADSRFENISGPSIVISDENNPRAQFNLKNIVCINVPTLAAFRESKKEINISDKIYNVVDFSHGLQITELGAEPELKTVYDIKALDTAPELVNSDIPSLPACDEWVNLISLGAKGDGETDDTEVIKNAVAKYKTIFLPAGRYLVSETIELQPNTVLIGLNPITTQFVLADETPAFEGFGSPKPLLETPQGGTNIVTGIGLDAGGGNQRALAAKWMAGENSLMNDVRFIGGHGTFKPNGSRVPIYNFGRTGPANGGWDSQYWSLWITNGGGGTFKDIWTPNTFAQAGIYISNTSTSGRIYAMSIEHHVRNEVIIRNVSNWKFYDIQMEEESAESPNALPIRIDNSSNLTFANVYLYRVIRIISPFHAAVVTNSSSNIEFNGLHVYSPTKFTFDNTLYDETHDYEIRDREIARLYISGNQPKQSSDNESHSVFSTGAKVEKVADGFEFIDGLTADSKGNVYFTDSRWKRIYRWSPEEQKLTLLRELLFTPAALGFDESDNLLITTNDGQVLSFDPNGTEDGLQLIKAVSPDSHKGQVALLPGHRWRDEHDFLPNTTYTEENPPVTFSSYTQYMRVDGNPLTEHFVSPDGRTFIPNYQDLRRAYSLRKAVPGLPYYMADEFGQKTYKFTVGDKGMLSNPELFAERGELDVAVDTEGNVFIPAGELYVYDKAGQQIDMVEVPERPACIVFGGKDGNILYIAARSSLYKIDTCFSGREISK